MLKQSLCATTECQVLHIHYSDKTVQYIQYFLPMHCLGSKFLQILRIYGVLRGQSYVHTENVLCALSLGKSIPLT